MTKKYKCCICKKMFEGFGNNPRPLLLRGRCCDNCNSKVIEARVNQIKKETLKGGDKE